MFCATLGQASHQVQRVMTVDMTPTTEFVLERRIRVFRNEYASSENPFILSL